VPESGLHQARDHRRRRAAGLDAREPYRCAMEMTTEERIAEYEWKIARCDAEERDARNAEMMAPALIYAGAGIAVASLLAHQTIGLTLGSWDLRGGRAWGRVCVTWAAPMFWVDNPLYQDRHHT
jgi:hypothetical protein